MEIQIYITKDDAITKDIEIEAPPFTMLTDTALSILQIKELGKTSFSVYCVILKHRNTKTNECFPSINTISKESGISVNTVKKTINNLEENGYLSINSGMRGTANNYYFPKEWFYPLFSEDFYQKNATRKHNAIKEKRETKLEKENRELKEELERLKANSYCIKQESSNCFNDRSPF